MFRLYIVPLNDQEEPRFAMMHDRKEYLVDRGEEWVRLQFIRGWYINEKADV